jgi:chromosome segregation ATPase
MDLDKISQKILLKMYQIDGETTASELRDSVGLEDNQSIHYRMDRKLIPDNLVHESDERREQPGSRKSARLYSLTDAGREWAEQNENRVTLTDLDDAEQELQHTERKLASVSEDVRKLKDWRQEQAGKSGGLASQVKDLRERVNEIEPLVKKHDLRDYRDLHTQLDQLAEQTSQLSNDVGSLPTQDDLATIENRIEDTNERISDLDRRLDTIEEDTNNWGTQMEQRVQQLEERTILDLLLPWR